MGIDKFKHVASEYRSWDGLNRFFQEKEQWMEDLNGEGHLTVAAIAAVKECWSNQLKSMPFYRDQSAVSQRTLDSMRQSNVLSNLGYESKMAKLDDKLKSSGGGISLKTISNKDKISSIRLFQHENWRSSTTAERRADWSWARNSPEAKLVNEMGKQYLETAKAE